MTLDKRHGDDTVILECGRESIDLECTPAQLKTAMLKEGFSENNEIRKVDFGSYDLRGTDLRGLTFVDCKFCECDLTKVNFGESKFIGCDFSESILDGANFSGCGLSGTDFRGASALSANFSYADLTDAKFGKAEKVNTKLNGANLTGATIHATDFSGADLRLANLDQARGVRPNFSGADLRGAHGEGMMAKFADFTKTQFGNTRFINGDFEQANLDNAKFPGPSRLPYYRTFGGSDMGGSPSVKKILEETREERAVAFMKATVRGIRYRSWKPPGIDIPVLRDPNGAPLVRQGDDPRNPLHRYYRLVPRTGSMPRLLYARPPSGLWNGLEGASKKMIGVGSGRTAGWVTLILKENAQDKRPCDPAVIALLQRKKFNHIAYNYQLGGDVMMAPDLGKDLTVLLEERAYHFQPHDFLGLAQDIDALHQEGIALGDIKPENLARKGSGPIKLFDLDFAQKRGSTYHPRVKLGGTPGMQPARMDTALGRLLDRGRLTVADLINKDKYNFFHSMMICYKRQLSPTGMFDEAATRRFVQSHHFQHQNELTRFLLDPIDHPLTRPLAAYFPARST